MKRKKEAEIVNEQTMTYEDYASLPDEGNRYELVDGSLELMSPGPSIKHQVVSFQFMQKISSTCLAEYLIIPAPIDLILSPKEVRQPDFVLIHRNRLDIITKRGIEGPPDLVVEILSPSSYKRDKVNKLKVYAMHGIPEYWIVDPLYEVLEQYQLQNDQYSLFSIYAGEDQIESSHIRFLSFTMKEIMENIPDLP